MMALCFKKSTCQVSKNKSNVLFTGYRRWGNLKFLIYTNLGLLIKYTIIKINISELDLITQFSKVVQDKYV